MDAYDATYDSPEADELIGAPKKQRKSAKGRALVRWDRKSSVAICSKSC